MDATDRVQETSESDNTHEQLVFISGRPLEVKVLTVYDNRLASGYDVYCSSSNRTAVDRNEVIFHVELLNCRQETVRGDVRVTQSGCWSE